MDKYCGTTKLPNWLNSFLSYFHNESCKLHDYHYEGVVPRIKADLIFFKNMLIASITNILTGLVQLCLSPIMFVFVLFFGYIFYNKDS